MGREASRSSTLGLVTVAEYWVWVLSLACSRSLTLLCAAGTVSSGGLALARTRKYSLHARAKRRDGAMSVRENLRTRKRFNKSSKLSLNLLRKGRSFFTPSPCCTERTKTNKDPTLWVSREVHGLARPPKLQLNSFFRGMRVVWNWLSTFLAQTPDPPRWEG